MEDLQRGRKWSILLVLSLALAIIILDTTLLNVSLSNIIRELNTTIQGIQWVIAGYSLTLAALTITGGRLGDLFGRKKMFRLGAVIFAIGSFITSISHNVPTMIAGEAIIEGIGAALMMPATSSILVSNFKGRDRAIGFGVWGAVAGASAALGPILGGYLTTHYSWRWGFRINIVVAALLILGSIIIPETRDEEEKPSLDWLGVFLSSTGLVAFVFGVIESSTYGWWKAKELFSIWGHTFNFHNLSIVPFAMVIGVALLALFAAWEASMDGRGKTPLVSPKLFQNRQFSSGVLVTSILSLGQSGIIFSVPVFLQAVTKLDALHTGLALLPMSIMLLIVAPLGAILSQKIPAKYLIQAGLVVNIIAAIALHQSFHVDSTALSFAPALAIFGLGMGMVMSQISNFTLSAVSPQEAGEASGVNNTMRQIGASLGSAVIGAVLISSLSTGLSTGITASSVIPNQVKAGIAQAAATQSSNVEFGGANAVAHNLPPTIITEIDRISKQATVDADRKSMELGILFAVLGFLVSFGLPNKKNLEEEKSVAAGH